MTKLSFIMRTEQNSELNAYFNELLKGLEPWESRSRGEAQNLKLAGISLSRAEAFVLRWAARLKPALKAVEIGTLTGLSGLYILDALKVSGTLWTLEKNEIHAQKAEPILKDFAKSQNKNVNLIVGDARETLEKIKSEGPFDFIFVDGNKAAYGDYLTWAEQNIKTGGILIGDNVLLSGEVALKNEDGKTFSKKQIHVMKDFNNRLMNSGKWRSVLFPTDEGMLIAENLG